MDGKQSSCNPLIIQIYIQNSINRRNNSGRATDIMMVESDRFYDCEKKERKKEKTKMLNAHGH